MTVVLIDTHVLAWSLIEPDLIEKQARSVLEEGDDLRAGLRPS